jgi:hypothetical protein
MIVEDQRSSEKVSEDTDDSTPEARACIIRLECVPIIIPTVLSTDAVSLLNCPGTICLLHSYPNASFNYE